MILYIDNGTNYVLFLEIARVLQKANTARMVFVTLIESRVALFRENGVEAVFLDLSSKADSGVVATTKEMISALESRHPNFRLDLGVKRDRILRFLPRTRARHILLSAADGFLQMLEQYRPALVLGEVSWAIEYLFYYLCADKGVRYRHILNIPGESLKVTSFDDRHTLASVIEGSPISITNQSKIAKSYAELCGEVKSYRISLRYFLRYFRLNYSQNDYRQAMFYRLRRVFLPFYKGVNRLFYWAFSCTTPDPGTSNILFTLHIQPESTPDFVSPFHADQEQIAKELVDALRSDQVLYIKDHPNTVSIRNLFAWVRLLRNPQVRLLSREISGRKIYSQFDCVVSIAGTALLECSELGVPALCLSDVYLRELPGVIDARDYPNLTEALSAALAYEELEGGNAEEVRRLTAGLGFPGFIHDARVSPRVLDPENVENLARLIERMLETAGDQTSVQAAAFASQGKT